MKRVALVVALVAVLPVIGNAQKPKLPRIIFTSDAGTLDLPDMFSPGKNPDLAWNQSRRIIREFKFYFGQFWKNPNEDVRRLNGGNNYNNLVSAGAMQAVSQRYLMNLSFEVGAIKAFNCLNTISGYQQSVQDTSDLATNVYENGGTLNSYAIDSALIGCDDTPTDSGRKIGQWSVDVQKESDRKAQLALARNPGPLFTPVLVGDIEPYPARSLVEHLDYLREIGLERAKRGLPSIAFYDLDIDIVRVNREQLVQDFRALLEFCRSAGIEVGVIVNGEDSASLATDNEQYYFQTATFRLVQFKQLGLLDKVQRVVVQSWARRSRKAGEDSGSLDIPINLPDTADYTHTNFVLHVWRCILGTVDDCGDYPRSPG